MGVSKNRGTPKSSILKGFSIINHPFWGTPIFGNIHIIFMAHMVNLYSLFFPTSEGATKMAGTPRAIPRRSCKDPGQSLVSKTICKSSSLKGELVVEG